MGIRYLLLAIAVWALFLLARRRLIRSKTTPAPHPRREVEMVPCCRCGLHLPRPEALQASGRYYCCPEHRDENRVSNA